MVLNPSLTLVCAARLASIVFSRKLLSISKYNRLGYFLNNSRTERDREARFSPFERERSGLSKHVKINFFKNLGKIF